MDNRKEILIGFAVGIIANALGTMAYLLLFSEMGVAEGLKAAVVQGHLGSLLALGALLNLLAFFGFLRLKRDRRAKGVMLATLLTALIILIYKVFM